ncbi:hypothetical protein [Roseovarius sp.]
MRFLFNPFRHRNNVILPFSPHLRRDIGLSEIDRSDWLIGRQISSVRGWL